MNKKIGYELSWNPNPNNRDKVISYVEHFELESKDNWSNAVDWLVECTLKFQDVFKAVIKEKK